MTATTTERPAEHLIQPAPDARATLRRMEWDSDFFGARMGQIAGIELPADDAARAGAAVELLRDSIAQARLSFDHVLLRFDAGDWGLVRAAEANGMRLVAVGVDSIAAPSTRQAGRVRVRPARPDDLPWAQEFGAPAFVYSRFSSDPFFTPEQVLAFHRQWVTNLWNGLARQCLVAEGAEGAPAGFVCCGVEGDAGRADTGRIILIASEAAARRSGVGTALVDAALDYFAQEGAGRAYVNTQASNIPALALYQRRGFVVSSCEFTYTWSPVTERTS